MYGIDIRFKQYYSFAYLWRNASERNKRFYNDFESFKIWLNKFRSIMSILLYIMVYSVISLHIACPLEPNDQSNNQFYSKSCPMVKLSFYKEKMFIC